MVTIMTINRLLGRPTLRNQNHKLNKSNVYSNKYATFGLSLAPHTMSGYQVCASSTPGCRSACIVNSGCAIMFPRINLARIAKTRLLFEDPARFKAMLWDELAKLDRFASGHGRKLAVRLNVFSDIMWEKKWPELFTDFSQVQFFDYTKHYTRMLKFCCGEFPENYHLTFSRSESNLEQCKEVLRAGGTVATVFKITPKNWKSGRPKKWQRFQVVDGDKTDLRFLDKAGTVIGLYAKGRARKDKTGFAIPMVTDRISLV